MITRKGEATRKLIIEASEQLFIEKNARDITINDVVKRAGVAKGTFYLYFDSKETLVWHYIETKLSGLNKYLEKLDVEGYEKEDIEKIILFIVSFLNNHSTVMKLMHHVRFFSFIGLNKMESKAVNKWVEWIYVWLEKGRIEGSINIGNSKFLAYFLVQTIHEVLEHAILNEAPFTIEEISEELIGIVTKILK